jgi:hypothetical protein
MAKETDPKDLRICPDCGKVLKVRKLIEVIEVELTEDHFDFRETIISTFTLKQSI